jgi:anti-sigma factor RsiW
MTQCTDHLDPETLSAFIDGELPPDAQQQAQLHLNECHSCALHVLSATRLKAATARVGLRFSPPPEILASLTASLHARPQPKKTASISSFRAAPWAALAAGILLLASLLAWRQIRQTNTLAAELLDQHLATISSGAAPQVISTDRHTVKPWFQGRLPFSFNLPDATALPPDTTLIGADLTYFRGQPAALLLFTIHKHQVSIFLTQRANGPMLNSLPKTDAGFSMDSANTRDLRILAVSDVNPADLDLLVVSLAQAQANN